MPEETINQYRTLQDLEERMRAIKTELAGLSPDGDLTEEDVNYQGTLIVEFDELDAKAVPLRKRMAEIDRVRNMAAEPANREEPRAGNGTVPETAPTMFVRSGIDKDPYKDVNHERMESGFVRADELRARAAALIELDENRREIPREQAEVAYTRSQAIGQGTSNGGVAKHMLLTGSAEYREAFRSYLEDPRASEPGTLLSMSENGRYRAVNLTNASGGFLLPYVLDPTIVLSNAASANPYRRVSRVVQTTSNAWQGVNSAGINAAWIAETVTAADASPTDLAQIKITPAKAAVWVLGTYEALDDTDFGTQLPGLLSDAKDRLESAAFATGTGTNSPLGIVVGMGTSGRVAPTTTGTAFNGTASIPDIGNLMAALAPRFRRSPACAFMANIVHINKIRSMDQYGGGGFWANLTSNTPPSLYGYPIYESSDLPSVTTGASGATGTASDTLFMGDWNQFIICDRVGVSMLYDPLIKGSGNAQLPAGMAGWFMFWRVGTAVGTTSAFEHLTVS